MLKLADTEPSLWRKLFKCDYNFYPEHILFAKVFAHTFCNFPSVKSSDFYCFVKNIFPNFSNGGVAFPVSLFAFGLGIIWFGKSQNYASAQIHNSSFILWLCSELSRMDTDTCVAPLYRLFTDLGCKTWDVTCVAEQ